VRQKVVVVTHEGREYRSKHMKPHQAEQLRFLGHVDLLIGDNYKYVVDFKKFL
jgi:hypothetical protein